MKTVMTWASYILVKFACEQAVYDGELSVTMTVKNEY